MRVDQARTQRGSYYHVVKRSQFTPLNWRLTPKAHSKDMSTVPQGALPSVENRNRDLVAQWRLKSLLARNGTTSLHDWRQTQPSQDLRYPLQVQNTPHVRMLSVANEPLLFIRRNKFRLSWEICNMLGTDIIYWSKGIPQRLDNARIGGFPINPGESHFEQSNTIAIDDIYIFTRTATVSWAVGFEGQIAPEANTS